MMQNRVRHVVDRTLEIFLVLIMAVSVLNVLWQVFTRFILKEPSSFTEELARFLLIWVGLLGASYASGKKMHLAIGVVLEKQKGKIRSAIELIIQACVFMFALLVMGVGGVRLVSITLALDQVSAALRIPLGYVYLVIPLSGLLIMYYSAATAVEIFQKSKEA